MEWERFDLLPSSWHAREYLRSYAELLGLDAQPYVEHYDAAFAKEERRDPARGRRRRVVLILLLAVSVFAALALVAAWLLLGDDSRPAT